MNDRDNKQTKQAKLGSIHQVLIDQMAGNM